MASCDDYIRTVKDIAPAAGNVQIQLAVHPSIRKPNVRDYVRINQRWWIEVSLETQVDVAIAEKGFQAAPIRFVEFKNRYFLEDPAVANTFTIHEVENHAAMLLPVVISLIRLGCTHFGGMQIRSIIEFAKSGRESRSAVNVDRRVLHKESLDEVLTFLTTSHFDMAALLAKSVKEADYREALYYLGRDSNPWFNLYKAFEIVSMANGGEAGLCEMGWCSRREMARFRHTANHPSGSGIDARHARLPSSGPLRPLSLEEAQSFVLGLIKTWGP